MGRTNHLATEPQLRLRVELPTYMGYDDPKSVADFLDEIESYSKANGALEAYALARVLPLALQDVAGQWWRLQSPFTTWADFCNALLRGISAPWVRATSPA
ncbi:hypothetical protein HPB50_013443 [Hyalomma asiaticum]|uniref:Uncharacterized protein n=1 Tax=Hyalomma asiaticum TaxID=266040 RepID=A0ACB7SEP7_HYAAI|nr:hypothetical protein HPB50_013443 [Hyalomma asiaticum]